MDGTTFLFGGGGGCGGDSGTGVSVALASLASLAIETVSHPQREQAVLGVKTKRDLSWTKMQSTNILNTPDDLNARDIF